MTNYRKILGTILLAFATYTGSWAQNGANSPLTRYGFGQLADQNLGGNKAMGGIGIGLRNGLQINVSNPASYTAVDSLTFLFETGFTLQNANFSDGTYKQNAQNASFDYLAMQFRLFNRMGMTIGFLPYSNVGYGFSNSEVLPPLSDWDDATTANYTYLGEGGLHQAFMGVGAKITPEFSVGANISYLFGNFTHQVATSFSDANIYGLSRTYYAEISDLKFDFGAQYSIRLNKNRYLTLGATYSLGKDINAINSYISEKKLSGSTVLSDSIRHINKAFQLPHAFGAGFTYEHNEHFTIGADVLLQQFGNTRFFGKEGQLADRIKCSVGAEYLPKIIGGNLLQNIKYRAGAYYSKPYVKVDGQDAAHEYGIGAGMAIPISTRFGWLGQSSAIINLSGEWVRIDPKIDGVLTENYLRLSIGLTFNERWFQKQKVR